MAAVTFALALPHTPWIPERVGSFGRLDEQLRFSKDDTSTKVRTFSDREPNHVWAQKMWRWAASTGASHLIQIQDDVIVAPNFWAKLRAMVTAVPDQIIGLEAAHPLGPEIWRKGERWYRTRAWLIGPAYVFPVAKLHEFLAWCDVNPDRVEAENEDTLVNRWAAEVAQYDVWHPCPTICDHDTSIPSTYAGNENHSHRRPTVTWEVAPDSMLESVDFWKPPPEPLPQRLVDPYANHCWYCTKENAVIASAETGARIGKACLAKIMGAMVVRL